MKDHPTLMTGEMVRAILEGRKTQTRRVIKPQPPNWQNMHVEGYVKCSRQGVGVYFEGFNEDEELAWWPDKCKPHDAIPSHICSPYGAPGDRLWVRETWRTCCPDKAGKEHIAYKATQDSPDEKWKPSIHMFKKDARLWLEVVSVRVERAQEISEEDALAEGITTGGSAMGHKFTAKEYFAGLWDSIYAKRGYDWESNPWVWVVEFERIEL